MRIRKDANMLNAEDTELIASASDALAHPARVQLFRYVYTENRAFRKVCNGDLVENFDYSQATVSQHMKKLTVSGLVDQKREGTKTYYFVNLGMLGKYLNAVKKLNDPAVF